MAATAAAATYARTSTVKLTTAAAAGDLCYTFRGPSKVRRRGVQRHGKTGLQDILELA